MTLIILFRVKRRCEKKEYDTIYCFPAEGGVSQHSSLPRGRLGVQKRKAVRLTPGCAVARWGPTHKHDLDEAKQTALLTQL